MTNISTAPAAARTDVRLESGTATVSPATVRKLGLGLTAGTATWAAACLYFGFSPTSEAGIKATDLTGFLFQLGVMGLLHVQLWTRATGTSRRAGTGLKVERVLLAVAMLWSVLHALMPGSRDAAWMHALDLFWPLSMLGMFFIGIKVAVKGRWRGKARLWSLLAETWAPICVPAVAILGHGLGDVVGGVHLLLGYATLGLIIATRPELVEDRG